MARKTYQELEELKKKLKVSRFWSWSRVNTYKTSKYEYLLKYVLKRKEDRADCIYAHLGGLSHDIIEKFYRKQIDFLEMIDYFEDSWLTASIADLKFDRNSKESNDNISKKYYYDLQHFFKNHIPIKNKIELERFITIKIGKHAFMGYMDACFKDNEGNFHILDWKTSSIYKGAKAQKECGQLVLYALALYQMGVPIKNIRIGWNFLKYINVEVCQANGKTTTREIERYELGSKLQSNVKMWLKKLGYEDKLLEYLDDFAQTNDIKVLPEDVQQKYKISDCYVYVDLDENILNEFEKNLISLVNEIISKEAEYEKTKDDKVFWDSLEEVKAESYYYATLCGYSANLHLPYKAYLEELDKSKNGDDLFVGVGSEVSEHGGNDGENFSWLEML